MIENMLLFDGDKRIQWVTLFEHPMFLTNKLKVNEVTKKKANIKITN